MTRRSGTGVFSCPRETGASKLAIVKRTIKEKWHWNIRFNARHWFMAAKGYRKSEPLSYKDTNASRIAGEY
jgi:hypothetical protein